MEYFVGLDGGGTKTIAYLGDRKGTLVHQVKGGPTNYHSVGIEGARKSLEEIFATLKDQAGVSLEMIQGLCLGGAGIDCDQDVETITKLFRQMGYGNALKVVNDGVTTLVGANGGKEGAIIISGTGSIAYGMDAQGNSFRVGGWGHLIDDGGSGYWIGRACLSRIMEGYDGRKSPWALWDKVKATLDLGHPEELVEFIYSPNRQKHHIAQLAPLVIEAYDQDEEAKAIIDAAIGELAKLLPPLIQALKGGEISLGLCGGLLEGSVTYRELFNRAIEKDFPNVKPHLPYDGAAKGALILAMEAFDLGQG